MRQFLNILRFEYANYTRNKAFIIITVLAVIVMAGMLSFPRVMELFKGVDAGPGDDPGAQKPRVALVDMTGADREQTLALFQAVMADKQIEWAEKDAQSVKQDVEADVYQSAIVIRANDHYQYIVKDVGMYDTTQAILQNVMQQRYRMISLQELGLDEQQIDAVLNAPMNVELVQTDSGKDQMSSFFYTYALCFLLYMAILLYGQFVATSVASEKSSRAMEVLITSAKPTGLMFGKVLGSGLAGLTQLTILLVTAFLFYSFNKAYWADNYIVQSLFDMPVAIMAYTIVFFVLGYFMYAFMYGALGSLASRMEDVNTLMMPVTFAFVIAFMIVMFSMAGGSIDSPLMAAASFIPFTSPMAMFVRIAMGSVAPWEIALSIAILVFSTVAVGFIAAGIYRIGVLLYGKPPKILQVFKMAYRANR